MSLLYKQNTILFLSWNGNNPHAHLLLTVRPLVDDGHWQYKTKKEYLCVRDGIRAKLEEIYGDKFDLGLFEKCVSDVDEDIHGEIERQRRHDRNMEMKLQSMQPLKKNHDDAR